MSGRGCSPRRGCKTATATTLRRTRRRSCASDCCGACMCRSTRSGRCKPEKRRCRRRSATSSRALHARRRTRRRPGASAGRSRRSTSHFPSWTRRNISAVWKAARPRALRRSWRRTARRIPAARCGAILQGGSTAASIRCCPSGFCRSAACCSHRRRGFRCCWS